MRYAYGQLGELEAFHYSVSMFFADQDALAGSLRAAGLGMLSAEVARSTRPAIYFQRQTVRDTVAAIGASKIGGLPDLPRGFTWPVRPPLANAQRNANHFREIKASVADMYERLKTEPWHAESVAKGEREPITDKQFNELDLEYETKENALFEPFPLAFVAQLDLSRLSLEAGFEPALPDTGFLTIFEDATCGEPLPVPRVFWHDCGAADLVRTDVPPNLVAYSDALSELPSLPWSQRTNCGLLVPHSVLSVPHHWKSAYARSSKRWDMMWEWFMEPKGTYWPESANDVTGFGDHLGGWPHDIQHHPELEIEGDHAGSIMPGETPWRHLFSYAGECYAKDMQITPAFPGDGNTFILIRDDDLAERRFERAGSVYQST